MEKLQPRFPGVRAILWFVLARSGIMVDVVRNDLPVQGPHASGTAVHRSLFLSAARCYVFTRFPANIDPIS